MKLLNEYNILEEIKPGDKVIAIFNGINKDIGLMEEANITVGKIYEVTEIESQCIRILDDSGHRYGWRKERFKKVSDTKSFYDIIS